jgi:tryptophan-rich sensory protein
MKKYNDLFLPIISGSIVGFIIKNSIDYSYINKPFLSPPKIVFPIAWSVIYILMGTSYYLYNKYNYPSINKLYYGQLIFNLIWSILFFTFKMRLLSIIWILILDILVIKLFITYYKRNKKIAYLNIIYLIWILFATYLNIGIYILN